jgi:hypothetical protein
MSKKATLPELEELHRAVAQELTARIRSGEAKPADIAAAIKFLKDNGVEATLKDGTDMQELVDSLPFPGEDEDTALYN